MSTSALAPAAQDEIATLFVGFELSKATWLIGLYSPQLGKTISRYKVDGGDVDAALERITVARLRLEKLGKPVRVVSTDDPAPVPTRAASQSRRAAIAKATTSPDRHTAFRPTRRGRELDSNWLGPQLLRTNS